MNGSDGTARGADRAARRPYGLAPPDHRLPEHLRLGRVVLQVADLDRSIDFYGQVLGLRSLEQTAGRVMLGAGAEHHALVELREKEGAKPVPARGRIGLYHFALLVPGRAALGRLVRHLAETGVRAGASDHLVSEALYLHDPDGLGIEVYADRPRGEWRHDQRQLVMATEPLDLDGLVRAAGGERWGGMPAGTRVGHLHLHVGELERAAHFYHEAIGFDRIVWSYPGALFLSAGGYHHHLGVNTWAAGSPLAGEDDARLVEWRIVLPEPGDLDDVEASLARNGYSSERGEAGSLLTSDPWGTGVRFSAERSSVAG
jgi:catechol 2,3-dioxygenase